MKAKPLASERVKRALGVIFAYGSIDGDHHKAWVLDQVVRSLTGGGPWYDRWVRGFEKGDDGSKTYEWNKGIPP